MTQLDATPARISLPVRETWHAPADRLEGEALHDAVRAVESTPLLKPMLDGYPDLAVLLNEQRQILACNMALLQKLGVEDPTGVIGRRLGEVLGCVHSTAMRGGCGTSEHCQTCGAVNAMIGCQRRRQAQREACRISTGDPNAPDAAEFEVLATPLEIRDQPMMILAARDVSANQRRAALERLFFHDTLNIAGGIRGLIELLSAATFDHEALSIDRLRSMARQLIEHILVQRDLALAEQSDLTPNFTHIRVTDLFSDLRSTYETHEVARGRRLLVDILRTQELVLYSDRHLLTRVLGNLIKNALEASVAGQTVQVRGWRAGDRVHFSVHNETAMPRDVQLQVFQRSFTTKGGAGRGLGTFSAKLLTSRYLGGEIRFESDVSRGTTFHVNLPIGETVSAGEPPAERRTSEKELRGRRFLLAEDDPIARLLAERLLTRSGAAVTLVENGQLAVETALAARMQGFPFDAVLLDMEMPVLSGFDAARELRLRGYEGAIIALSAHAEASARKTCLDAGCNDYACKPIDRETLVGAVTRQVASPR